MNSAFGHADFYPHGGRQQPQCGANFNCSHGESYRYYIDSVRTGGCGFAACTAQVSLIISLINRVLNKFWIAIQ